MNNFKSVGITTQFIQDHVAKAKFRLRNDAKFRAELDSEFEINKVIEIEALETKGSICKVGKYEASPNFLDLVAKNADPVVLQEVMSTNFTNYQALKAVACEVYANFIGIAQEDGNIAKVLNLKDHIQNLHEFGDPSAFGHALTGDLKGVADLYVVKTPISSDSLRDSAHELFVGLIVMNEMRKYLPNFMFTFGGFSCGTPRIDPVSRKVITWGGSGDLKIPWVLYEPITPSVSFRKYVKSCSVSEFYSCFTQFLYATEIAFQKCGWTHYDAHDGNWLIENKHIPGLGEIYSIPYARSTGTRYVSATRIAVAIDYGQATVNYKGRPHGMQAKGLRSYGMRSGPSPLHDVYKLLMFLGSRVQNVNKPVYRELQKLFKFFNDTEDFDYCLKHQGPATDLYYIYPNTEYTMSRTIGELIDYADAVWDLDGIVSSTPLYDELRCTSCYTFAGVIRDSGVFSADFIFSADTFEKFYDVAIYMSKHSVNQYDRLVETFDYSAAKDKFQARCHKELNKISVNKDLIQPAVVSDNPNKLATKTAEKGHILTHLKLFELVGAYEDLELLLKIGSSLATVFQDSSLITQIATWRSTLATTEPTIRNQIHIARVNYQQMYKVINTDLWNRLYNKPFPWYITSAGDIETLVTRFKRDTAELFVEARLPAALFKTSTVPKLKNLARGLYPKDSKLKIVKDRNGRVTDVSYNK